MTVPVDRLPRVEGSGTWPPPLTAGTARVTRLKRSTGVSRAFVNANHQDRDVGPVALATAPG
jgi:hypothetical protein